jgi:hypothetical protein
MLPITSHTRVKYDSKIKALRSWFDTTTAAVSNKEGQSPRDFVLNTLKENAGQFAWLPSLSDLKDHATLDNGQAFSVRFTQLFKDVPVDSSEIVANMYKDGRLFSIYNNYHYDIPDELEPQKIKIGRDQAGEIVDRLLRRYKEYRLKQDPILIIYQYYKNTNRPPKGDDITHETRNAFLSNVTEFRSKDIGEGNQEEGKYFIAWDFRVLTRDPVHYWRILIDANTGLVINVVDLAQYATGTGKVFDPNPIVTSGDITLRHNSTVLTINNQRVPVTMDRLNAADGSGNLHLDGSFVNMAAEGSPAIPEPTSAAGDFEFSFDDNRFLNAMCYYHIDRFQNYVQVDLGMSNVANYSIPVDPQSFGGADNSQYVGGSGSGYIEFGGGIIPVPANNPVPDAADAMVVLHEYGHAIQDNCNPGFDDPPSGTGEGFGDFLAAVYYDDKHANPTATRGYMMSWDSEMATGSWSGRRYDLDWLFDGPEYTGAGDNHIAGQLWAAAMFEIYRKLGGDSQYPWVKSSARDLSIRLHLMANFNVPAHGSTAAQMGQQVEAADSNLGGWRYANGLHKKVIYDTFRRRHLSGFPLLPVDVYINDGRNGGYGSPTGNDLFSEKLFLDNYWSTQDLWVKVSPYASDADQQAGDSADHVEPPVGSLANLYVRVKNKGTSGSGSVTVKAYHSDPTIGLVWPVDWTPTYTPSLTVADIPAGGTHIFGPFPWTPMHVGHECVFAIVECANDRAVTQDLLSSDVVAHADLVPFDNNIGQRNLYPTASKGKMTRGFYVSNPLFERTVVQLHFESTLPKGWTFHSNLATENLIHLAPRERRWVEVYIDQAEGAEVTDFTNAPALVISGSINGRLIGGMGFYVAPPSAFPATHHKPSGPVCEITKPEDLFCMNIPWKDCDFEGEINLRLRFWSKK